MAPAPVPVVAQSVPYYPAPVDAAQPVPDFPVPPMPYSNYSAMPQAELKTGLAITAMVLGIVNFTCSSIFVIPVIAGIVISAVSLSKIKNYPHEYGGKPMAVAGLVMNIIAALTIPMMLAIAIPNLLASRRAANEGAAMQSMRTIASAEQTFQSTAGRGEYGTLIDLWQANMISQELANGTKWGYQFKVQVFKATGYSPARFTAVAVPTAYGSSGQRSFFIDESGVLRGEDSHGLEANRSSPPIGDDRDYPPMRSGTRRSTSYGNDE